MRRWAKTEIDFLREHYPNEGKTFCVTQLQRPEGSIRKKAFKLRLRISHSSQFFQDFQRRAALSKVGRKRPAQARVMAELHRNGKLLKSVAQKQAAADRLRLWMRTHEHPRGARGLCLSKEARRRIGEASRRTWANPRSLLNSATHRRRLSDRMFEAAKQGKLGQGYSRGKGGRRPDLGNHYFRSKWEANYARYLNWMKSRGEIFDWSYEVDTFWFDKIERGTRSYTPDFKIWEKEGATPYYVEVKGWMDGPSKTRLKRMAKYHPTVRIVIFAKEEYKSLKILSRTIVGWE